MKKIKWVVGLVTAYVVFFQLTPLLGVPDQLVYTLFVLFPFLLIYMVLVILKNGKPSKHRFDQRFYEDWDYERKGGEG